MESLMQEQGASMQEQVGSDNLYAAQIQEDRVRNLIQQISPDNQLMDLQWRIKGYVKNPKTNQWEKTDKDIKEISPILVSRYISYLSSILNQNTTLSNLSSTEINGIMKQAIEWLTDDLDSNAERYGLKDDFSERTRIGHILLNQTFFSLKRSQNGMESRRIFKTMNVHESLNPESQRRGGMLDAFKFWKN